MREATLTQEFVNSIVQTDRIYEHFKPWSADGLDPELGPFFRHMSNLRDVLKVKAYGADSVLLWDSDGAKPGQSNYDNDELALSLEGNLVTEFGRSHAHAKAEHRGMAPPGEEIHFVETYIPVWNADFSRVLGSVELYKEPRVLHAAIVEGQYYVWAIALVGAVVLYSTLFWIVWRANGIIHMQQGRLVESERLSMIGETASAVAHAMRNALASIRASAELTLDDDLEGARESAHDIINESDRLNRWAGELLKFSGDGGDELEDIDLADLLDQVVDEHQTVMHRANIRFIPSFAPGRFIVRANRAPLSQVFGNLIMNAVEAMEKDGELSIRLTLPDHEVPTVRVDVIDNGPGLSEQIIGQLFKPFATTKPSGTGLGLALTRRMLSRYDGSIAILGEPGKGVTARVELPLKSGAPA